MQPSRHSRPPRETAPRARKLRRLESSASNIRKSLVAASRRSSRRMLSRMLKLALLVALALAPPAAGRAADTPAFTAALMRHLGLDPAKRLPELERGAVL